MFNVFYIQVSSIRQFKLYHHRLCITFCVEDEREDNRDDKCDDTVLMKLALWLEHTLAMAIIVLHIRFEMRDDTLPSSHSMCTP